MEGLLTTACPWGMTWFCHASDQRVCNSTIYFQTFLKGMLSYCSPAGHAEVMAGQKLSSQPGPPRPGARNRVMAHCNWSRTATALDDFVPSPPTGLLTVLRRGELGAGAEKAVLITVWAPPCPMGEEAFISHPRTGHQVELLD